MSVVSSERYAATLVPSYGIQRIPHLEAFLPESERLVRSRRFRRGIDSVAGWGFKSTAAAARQLARDRGIPYLALEDGFFRSIAHGEAGASPVSMIVDDLGIYYDARQPSRLERILASRGWETPELLDRAERARRFVVATGLSKTNADPPLPPDMLPPRAGRRRVLVVDQTLGDASILGGMASRRTFAEMLAAARAEEPEAQIIVRRHPLVAAGLKQGCLDASELGDVTFLDRPARAAAVLGEVDAVYTVSSIMGFEALLRGLPVRCFGMPFYAGWSLSTDQLSCDRRIIKRTATEMFAAACILYTRYVDPLTGEACSLETALDRLQLFREHSDRNAGYTAAVGFSRWKHNAARRLLSSCRGEVEFHRDPGTAIRVAGSRRGRVVIWGSRADAVPRTEVPIVRMEDGFIRSAGLGSDLVAAQSAVLDDLGIYYDPATVSRLEALLEEGVPPDLLARAAALRQALVATGLTKYNMAGDDIALAPGPERLLVVGQVEDDQSVLRGSPVIRSNLALLEAVRSDHPEAYILYKPHPDVAHGTRAGRIEQSQALRIADQVVDTIDIVSAFRAVDAVATMTSLTGFEALLRGLPVYTYGIPFYAGWGLTTDALSVRRRRRLSLDELVAGAMLVYSIYVDPVTGLPCSAEHLVARLAEGRRARPRSRPVRLAMGMVERLRTRYPPVF